MCSVCELRSLQETHRQNMTSTRTRVNWQQPESLQNTLQTRVPALHVSHSKTRHCARVTDNRIWKPSACAVPKGQTPLPTEHEQQLQFQPGLLSSRSELTEDFTEGATCFRRTLDAWKLQTAVSVSAEMCQCSLKNTRLGSLSRALFPEGSQVCSREIFQWPCGVAGWGSCSKTVSQLIALGSSRKTAKGADGWGLHMSTSRLCFACGLWHK